MCIQRGAGETPDPHAPGRHWRCCQRRPGAWPRGEARAIGAAARFASLMSRRRLLRSVSDGTACVTAAGQRVHSGRRGSRAEGRLRGVDDSGRAAAPIDRQVAATDVTGAGSILAGMFFRPEGEALESILVGSESISQLTAGAARRLWKQPRARGREVHTPPRLGEHGTFRILDLRPRASGVSPEVLTPSPG